MRTVLSDFEKKVTEIELYFQLIENILEKGAVLYFSGKKTHKYKNVDPELQKVLKANVFLLLYNLVESAVKQSMTEIHDVITSRSAKYGDVVSEIRMIWIKNHYKNFSDVAEKNIYSYISNIANDVIELSFDSDKTISGNIDAQKVQGLAKKFGFSSKTHYTTRNGSRLHTVKTKRNTLAHGNQSFAECGRDYTYSELEEIKKQVIAYLRQILRNINDYLDQRKFLV